MSTTRVITLARRQQAGPEGDPAARLLGPCDEAALRVALALCARPGSSLVVLAAGPAAREDAVLAEALQRGADRAIRISDPSLEGIDYHGIARVLSAAARRVGFDLILVGAQSADEAIGAVGPAVAEALAVPHITSAVDVDLVGGAAVVTRREDAQLRTLALPLPAVVTVTRSSAAPAAGADGRRGAIETMSLSELGIQPPELRHRVHCVGHTLPAATGPGATIVARPDDLIARLHDARLLEP